MIEQFHFPRIPRRIEEPITSVPHFVDGGCIRKDVYRLRTDIHFVFSIGNPNETNNPESLRGLDIKYSKSYLGKEKLKAQHQIGVKIELNKAQLIKLLSFAQEQMTTPDSLTNKRVYSDEEVAEVSSFITKKIKKLEPSQQTQQIATQ